MSLDELEAYVRAEIRALDSQIGHLCDRIAKIEEKLREHDKELDANYVDIQGLMGIEE